jgi:hypothetical protein
VQELNQHHVIWGTPLLHHNVGKAIINHPYFDGLQHIYGKLGDGYCSTNIIYLCSLGI